ncbi:hypothetical protein HGRIS_008306 [Hohenbuehelia grisea]|uniref:Peptidase A1 domain-containing protein n=1 Tax=Hohenbuehelia grisea TaxID=104357 RepID=A0ABR3J912_9AGAR
MVRLAMCFKVFKDDLPVNPGNCFCTHRRFLPKRPTTLILENSVAMFCIAALLAYVLAALLVAASPTVVIREPPINLPVSKRYSFARGMNMVQSEQARARMMREKGMAMMGDEQIESRAAVSSIPATNGVVTYTAQVTVGNNSYSLIIDTGSSNTWVGARKAYTVSNTTVKTNQTVSVSYGSGSFSGTQYLDRVSLGSSLVINNQSIGAASKAQGFNGVDGILGVGPTILTQESLSPLSSTQIPTVVDSLTSQGIIPSSILGVSFAPSTSPNQVNGQLTFGGTDSSKYTGSINYIPITSRSPSSAYWGINQSIVYGNSTANSTNILSSTAGIVDTGTTLILLATDAFKRYATATGGVPDSATGLLRLTPAQYTNLSSLFFNINGINYELTPNAQIWPRSLNVNIGGSKNFVYSIVADLGSNSGTGFDFINGFSFLERYYSVYDTKNKRVGLASTANTRSTSN